MWWAASCSRAWVTLSRFCSCWLAQRSPSPWALQVWLVKLAEVESPEEAALLRGHTLLIPASARQSLEDEDEFYVQVRRWWCASDRCGRSAQPCTYTGAF